MPAQIDTLALSSRVVLLSMTQLSQTDETPVHTGRVIRATTEHVADIDADTIGKLDEAEVNRALNRLEADDFVEQAEIDDTSPVGKGRPTYTLNVDTDTVLTELADDAEVAPLAEKIRAEV